MPSAAQGALKRAANKLGLAQLAESLGISRTKLSGYISGFAPIPDNILLRTLDLLVEDLYANPPASSETPLDFRRDPA